VVYTNIPCYPMLETFHTEEEAVAYYKEELEYMKPYLEQYNKDGYTVGVGVAEIKETFILTGEK